MRAGNWQVAPGAVVAGRDISGTVHTGPMYVRVVAGTFDSVQDAIFDPAPLADQLELSRFHGRKALVATIEETIGRQDRGYIVVRGEAGVGKSALAAHLVWTRPCVHHFTRIEGGARNPVEARKSLAAQLIGGWGLADRFTPGDAFPAAALRPDWLAKVIRAAAAARDAACPPEQRPPIVLVIDGLDEAEPDAPGMGTGIPLGLPAPDALPSGVHIVATSRYGLPLVALRDPLRVGWSQIEVASDSNLADMAAYLRAAAGLDREAPAAHRDAALTAVLARHGVNAEAFTSALLRRCGGVWIYLRYVLDEIRAGIRPPADVSSLPGRLRGFYELQVQRWSAHPDWDRVHLPALALLTSATRPLTSVELAGIMGDPAARDRLTDWLNGSARAFLDVLAGPDRAPTYQVRHQSLRDLFAGDPDGDAAPVDAGLTERLALARATAHRLLTAWLVPAACPVTGRRDWDATDDYTRLELPAHAAGGGVLDGLMTDPGFLLTCSQGHILRYRHTLSDRAAIAAAAALEAAATSDWPAWSPDRRAWWLHIWAGKTRCTDLVRALAAAHPGWSWHVEAAIWSGTTHRTLAGHQGGVSALTVVPAANGARLIISAHQRTLSAKNAAIRVWDADSGTRLAEFREHRATVTALTMLPTADGGNLVASGDTDGMVTVWDPASGARIAEFTDNRGGVTALTTLPAPDGRRHLVSGHDDVWSEDDGPIQVWDLEAGECVAEFTGHGRVTALATIPARDGRHHLVSGDRGSDFGDDGTVRVWDPEHGTQVADLPGHKGGVTALAILPGPDPRHRIVTGDGRGDIRIWEPGSDVPPVTFHAHGRGVGFLAFMPGPDGRRWIVSGDGEGFSDRDGSVRVWDPETGVRSAELTGHRLGVGALAVLPAQDGRHRVVSGDGTGSVRVWDPDSSVQVRDLVGHDGGVTALALLPAPGHRYRIVSGDGGGSVRVWDPDRQVQVAALARHDHGISALVAAIGPGRKTHVVSGDSNEIFDDIGTLTVWNVDDDTHVAEFPGEDGGIMALTAIPAPGDGFRIVSGQAGRFQSRRSSVRTWDPHTQTEPGEYAYDHGGVTALTSVLDADGRRWIVSGDSEGTIRIADADRGDVIEEFAGQAGGVTALAVLPGADGRHRIVSGHSDAGADRGHLNVWDLDWDFWGDGCTARLARSREFRSGVTALALLPGIDGLCGVVAGDYLGSVHVWDPEDDTPLAEFHGHMGPVSAVLTMPHLDGHRIVTASYDNTLTIWAPSPGAGLW
ncbi:WD40 repeat domain-containing protein [Actinoplanes sp. L3-i22]|uniref:WD40 repeat domain-containing protein n=1 Tax=Actinoplanes sp. L3-i22 TaxID=2836373 RepID=UPI001C77812D|nr:WD40 repeat domain-containing protein [Actinoplanes sp. L3-i22]BCY11418.1 hypothetical protein L3i22_065060 [Actinoplanes sp. L3-i22]